MTTYEIDGQRFSTLEEFYEEVGRVLRLSPWGHNLDAFNDILRGGFGTPEEGFAIRWKNHNISREKLGYPETVCQLSLRLARCAFSAPSAWKRKLKITTSLMSYTMPPSTWSATGRMVPFSEMLR